MKQRERNKYYNAERSGQMIFHVIKMVGFFRHGQAVILSSAILSTSSFYPQHLQTTHINTATPIYPIFIYGLLNIFQAVKYTSQIISKHLGPNYGFRTIIM